LASRRKIWRWVLGPPLVLALVAFLGWQRPWDSTQPLRLERLRFEHGGIARKTLVYDPKAGGPRPLVIVLHGGMSMAERGVRQSNFNALAKREGFLVAYPDGTGPNPYFFHSWNAGHCCGGPMRAKVDDVGLVGAVIDRLVASGRVDPARVYVTGFSAGGMLAHKAGIELPGKITAIAPVSGALFGDEPAPKAPLSVMMVRYAGDTTVPGEGVGPGVGYGFATRDLISVDAAGAYWAKAGGCGEARASTAAGYRKVEWPACASGVEVAAYTVDGGEHAWPGGGFDSTARIWDFFKHQTRPGVAALSGGEVPFSVAPSGAR